MTTKYFATKNKCEYCGHKGEPIELGYKSCGWAFASYFPIEELVKIIEDYDHDLENEYGQILTRYDLNKIIFHPSNFKVSETCRISKYENWEDFYTKESCWRDEKTGLLRRRIGGIHNCIKNYDEYCIDLIQK